MPLLDSDKNKRTSLKSQSISQNILSSFMKQIPAVFSNPFPPAANHKAHPMLSSKTVV